MIADDVEDEETRLACIGALGALHHDDDEAFGIITRDIETNALIGVIAGIALAALDTLALETDVSVEQLLQQLTVGFPG